MTDQTRPIRVLVLDDKADDRQLVLRELKAIWSNVVVIEVGDLATFEAALEARVPDLVVTDLDLRWASGRDAFVRTKLRYPTCPVVMFTGTGNETVAVELMKAGLDDYVVKSARQLPRLRASLRMAIEIAASRSTLSEREAQLTALAAHKDTIARELHHRVKNNLQMITSLLYLRARQVDAVTSGHLQEMAGRMEALASVQSRIYDTGDLDRVDFQATLSDIAQGLLAAFGGDHISLGLDFDNSLELEVSRAMPLGLLCYEVILNAFKHAWPDTRTGKLTIELRTIGAHTEVRICDDGTGFEERSVAKGLGTRLVRSLAAEAKTEVGTSSKPGGGTTVTVKLV